MATEALTVQHLLHPRLAGPFGLIRRAGEKLRRALLEVFVDGPARVDNGPVEMILEHPLQRPAQAELLGREAGVEVNAVRALQVVEDEDAVAEHQIAVADEGDLAFRRLGAAGPLEG